MPEQSINQTATAMDLTLDDIEDLPGFETPPSGQFICSLTLDAKDIKDKSYVSFDFKLVEVKQLGDQELDQPAIVGQKFNVLFQYNEQGLQYMKPYLKQFKEALKTTGSVPEIIEAVTDLNVLATFKYSKSVGKAGTANAGKEYKNYNISKLEVL